MTNRRQQFTAPAITSDCSPSSISLSLLLPSGSLEVGPMDVVNSIRNCLSAWSKGGESEWYTSCVFPLLVLTRVVHFHFLLVERCSFHHIAIRWVPDVWTRSRRHTIHFCVLSSILGHRNMCSPHPHLFNLCNRCSTTSPRHRPRLQQLLRMRRFLENIWWT